MHAKSTFGFRRLSPSLLLGLASVLLIGGLADAGAGTRFSNRKSRGYGSGGGGERESRPAVASASRTRQAMAIQGQSTGVSTARSRGTDATLPVTMGAKPARKGFFARLRERSEERESATVAERQRRAAQERETAQPAGELSARIDRAILATAETSATRVVVDIAKQRAYLLVGDKVAVDTPVSTARPGKYTPRGTFRISQRVPTGKVSTIYGVEMPYWMRLDGTVFGMHAGYLPGYPASAGCIRLPSNVAPTIFSATQSGTQVSIYSSWSGS